MKLTDFAAAALGGLLSLVIAGAALAQDPVRRGPAAGATAAVGDLAIGKLSTGPLQVGKVAVFRLVVRNGGTIPMGQGVKVTDIVSSDFTAPITATGPGWNCAVAGQTVTCQYIGPPIPPGSSFPPITINAKAAVAGPYNNCAVVQSTLVPDGMPGNNQACISGNLQPALVLGGGGNGNPRSTDPGGSPVAGPVGGRGPVEKGGPDAAGDRGPFSRRTDLSVSKRALGTAVVGQPLSFAITVTNNGPNPVNGASAVQITDTLDTNFTGPVTFGGTGWTCVTSLPVVTCYYSGSPVVFPGQALPVLTITARVGNAPAYTNCADVMLRGGFDPNPRNNRICIQGQTTPGGGGDPRLIDLSLSKRPAGPIVAGQPSSFELVVTNNGPSLVNASTGVKVVDTLPAGFTGPITGTGAGWSCGVIGTTITCTYSGAPPVPSGQTLPVLTITAVPGLTKSYVNCAVVSNRQGRDTNPGNDRACVEGPIQVGKRDYDVLVRKAGPAATPIGQTASFTLSPYNTGPAPVSAGTGVTVIDQLPPGFGPPTISALGWTCNVSGSGPYLVTCNLTATTTFGANSPLPTITINTVANGPPGGYTNCAEISLRNARDVRPGDNKFCIGGEIRPKPTGIYDVGIEKKGPGPLTVGQTATFVLSPYNVGPSPVNAGTGVVVTDTLPSPPFGGNATVSGGPNWNCSASSGLNVSCLYIGPPVGQGQPLPPITVTLLAVRPGRYQNCADIALTRVRDANPKNDRDCVEGPVSEAQKIDVRIVKDGPTGPVTAGGNVLFTLVPFNDGPATVTNGMGLVVTDQLPINFIAPVTVNGGANWTCVVSTGVPPFTVTCTYIGGPVVGSGPLGPILIEARAQGVGPWTNCAFIGFRSASGNITVGADSQPGDNRSCMEGSIVKPVSYDVGIRKQGPGPLTVGQTGAFTLTPINNGPTAVNSGSGVVVTDVVPSPPFGGTATVNGGPNWDCSASTGLSVSCAYIGPNVTGVMPTITISALATSPGVYRNCARITRNIMGADTNPANNESCVDGRVTEEKKVDVRINKTGPSVIEGGLTATFTLAPFNNGPATITSSMGLAITDGLPINFGSPVVVNGGPNWTCNVPNTVPPFTVNCDYIGPPVPPTSPFPSITITARAGAYGPWTNCAIIGFRDQNGQIRPAPDVAPADNRSCISGEVVRPRAYDVSIRKLGPGPLTVGQTATFTLNPTNIGPTPVNAASGVVVTDNLPSPPFGGTPTVNGGANWDCSASSGLNVSCRYVGGAITGPMPVITISVPVTRPGDYRNCAQIALTQVGPDTNPGNNNSCVEGPVTEAKKVDVRINKTGPSVIEGGLTATFTLAPFNNGPATVTSSMGLAITDNLPINFGSPVVVNGGPNWTCNVPNTVPPFTVNCDYTGPPVPPTSPFPTITITARAGAYGPWTNCAIIGFRDQNGQIRPAPDVAPADNRSCISGEVVRPTPVIYDLSIDKRLYDNTASYNDGGVFDLRVTNLGAPIPPGGKLTVTDALPAGMTVTGPNAGWTCTPAPPVTGPANYVCSYLLPNGLPTSGTVTLQHSIYFVGPQRPGYTNCASVAAYPNATSSTPLGESNTVNNNDCQTVTLPPLPTPNLSLTKTLPAPCQNTNAGVICTFVFTITNNGGTTYTGPVSLTDAMTFTSANGTVITGVTGGFACTPGSPSSCQGNVSLNGGASTSFSATFNTTGPVLPTQNCAQLTAPVSAAQPGPSCVPITFVSSTPPVLSIEKVVEKDCTGTPPDTHCRFKVRVFNNGPGAYIGTVSFTDLVTSFGSPTGNVSLVAPFPSGWTCTGSQPMTCTSGLVTIPQNGMISATLWMDMQPPIPPDTNCARLTAPGLPTSCAGMGPPRFDMGVDSNFIAAPGQPGFHDFLIYVSSNPAVIPGYQIKINGSLTSAYGTNTFSAMTVVNSPNWTCSPTTWSAFQCIYTVPSGYSGGLIPLTLRTSYPTTAIGSAFNYTVTVTTIGNTDPNGSNNTRSVNGTLF